MTDVIEKLLQGEFQYESGSLDFSCPKIELTITAGESAEGSFSILGKAGRLTEGDVFSTDSRMECLTTHFIGSNEEISYCFHGENIREGEVIKGEFCVISNQGEYYLPFVVVAEYKVLTSSMGNIKNLFHFANLTRSEPEEALALFYSESFRKIFTGSDRQYLPYYEGLSIYSGRKENVEEFLIGIHKKQQIEYLTVPQEITIRDPEGVSEYGITITRNGWGFTELRISTDGDFLYTEKEILTEQDFLANSCRLPFYIEEGMLHAGNNYGSIRIKSRYGEKRLPVTVNYRGAGSCLQRKLEEKRITARLVSLYLDFRMKKMPAAEWLEISSRETDRLLELDGDNTAARLYKAQLLITEGRINEGEWMLRQAGEQLEGEGWDAVLHAYSLYLSTLLLPQEEDAEPITAQVEELCKQNPGEWKIAWLLLYLSPAFAKSISRRWMFLEEQYHRGCNSPVIFAEALLLLNQTPSLLIKAGGFEKTLLDFGRKHDFISRDAALQFSYLVQKEKDYSPRVFAILRACYEKYPEDAILQEICSLLIKGNKTGRQYFTWYQAGVERELRITRLYEYYLMSADRNRKEALSKIVLMYFVYQNNLDYELAAFLYANVYRNRDAFPELYGNYAGVMEQFVTEQILKRRINRDLAYLYKHFLKEEMVTEEVAAALCDLLCMHLVRVESKAIRYVVVRRYGMEGEVKYPVTAGEALAALGSAENYILLEDGEGCRYMDNISYTVEKLLIPGKLVKLIAPFYGNNRQMCLNICTNGYEPAEVTAENEKAFAMLLADEGISADFKRAALLKLLRYDYDADKMEELDDLLQRAVPEGFTDEQRSTLIKFMVMRGMEQKAYDWLAAYGPFGWDAKVLVRLCSRRLPEDGQEDEVLTEALWYAFKKGKYDEKGLQYLVWHFGGTTKELRDLYKAAKDFGISTHELCERMLVQMLFTGYFVGERMTVYADYVRSGAREDVEKAFLTQCSYDYFVKDRITEAFLFERMQHLEKEGVQLLQVCRLAFVKYFAEHRAELTAEKKELVIRYVRELIREGICLRIFADFIPGTGADAVGVADRTIVEYKANPNARAVMNYYVETADMAEPEYVTEEMKEIVGGVCFRDFVLFFGESLKYYIVEKAEGREQLTESATLQKNDSAGAGGEGRFGLINDICISSALQEYDTVDELLEEFQYKEYMQKGLFRLR